MTINQDILNYDELKDYLNTEFIGRNIIHFDELNSTNTYAKSIASDFDGEGQIVITEKQLSGRGRLGRQWVSQNNKGIWMSIILKPKINIAEVSKITQVAAAAINLGLSFYGVKTEIKWPNDIIINNKKICGILVEMNSEKNISTNISEDSKINYVVVGIGINVNNDIGGFPEELRETATSKKIETNKEFKRNILVAEILYNFEKLYIALNNNDFSKSLDICRKNSYVIGKEINLIKNQEIKEAKALHINDDGELIVMYKDGKTDNIISGEISVRIRKNYRIGE